jgi:hypothetical protein
LALAVVIALMQIPWLNPASVRGRYFATLMVITWCIGLALWLLGIVRRHRSRFGMRTLCIMVTIAAIYLGAWTAFGPSVPTLLAAGVASAAMLDSSRDEDAVAAPFRNRLCRAIMAAGGLLMLAHICRLFGYTALVDLGILEKPDSWV